MKYLRRVFILLVLLAILPAAPILPAQASAASEPFLNTDGALDPRRGPGFKPLALNGTWSTLGSGLNGEVTAIAVSGSDIYVGGWFTTAGGISANYIARWDSTTSTWSALGSGLNNVVMAIVVSGSDIYVGGWFTQAGGISANYIARWDSTTSTWSALGSGTNNWVYAIAVSGSNVYVGGWFTTAGGISANRIARWDSTTSTWSALGSGLNDSVYSIAISGSNIYVGGLFTQAGGVPANYIARWDGTAWFALGSGTNSWVITVAINGSDVYVGGAWGFTAAGGIPANRIAAWDSATSTWSALGSGLNDVAYTITLSGPNIYVGGRFTQAGGISANYIARFLVDTTPPVVVFGAGSVPPSNGANLTTGPSQLVVRFSKNVLGDGSPNAANSLWNYMLLRPGPNGVFDTPISTPGGVDPICDLDHVRVGDDEKIDLFGATYNATSFAATLTIDPLFAPLANGMYRLYVCGAASVDDLAGNRLNGGSNTAINFTVSPAAVQAASGGKRSSLPGTGFAPNRVTILPPQTVSYSELGDLWLEIPKLGLKMPIVGVPRTNDQWDVSWLGAKAGSQALPILPGRATRSSPVTSGTPITPPVPSAISTPSGGATRSSSMFRGSNTFTRCAP